MFAGDEVNEEAFDRVSATSFILNANGSKPNSRLSVVGPKTHKGREA
jgi:hypothetical protein